MRVTELSGGVGGARMARGLAGLEEVDLTVIVNVGDDTEIHGFHVSPDLDTVIYTLAGVQGPFGWGRARDTFEFNEELARFGLDNTFSLGDRDLALKSFRTNLLAEGVPLSEVTGRVAGAFELDTTVLPASDDPVPTSVLLKDGWVGFHDYFVSRQHRDEVLDLEYRGSSTSTPAPDVIQSIEEADCLVIGPSNPLLSIAPILSVPGISEIVAAHPRTVAVSPLIGGKAVKGPADRVMLSMGYSSGNRGIAEYYRDLADVLVIHEEDVDDDPTEMVTHLTNTLIEDRDAAIRVAKEIIQL